jgi:2-methylaconitate cis-trans-isomerase PrpF
MEVVSAACRASGTTAYVVRVSSEPAVFSEDHASGLIEVGTTSRARRTNTSSRVQVMRSKHALLDKSNFFFNASTKMARDGKSREGVLEGVGRCDEGVRAW